MPLARIKSGVIEGRPVVSAPTDSSRLLVVGESQMGALVPYSFRRARDMDAPAIGARTGAFIATWDAVDVAVQEEVPEVIFTRAVGSGATAATANIPGGTGTALVVTADGPGIYGNGAAGGLTWEIVNGPNGGTERQLVIAYGGREVERSPVFTAATKATVLYEWGRLNGDLRQSRYVTVEMGADTGLPTVASASNLAGGTDGSAVDSAAIRAALDRVPIGLGPMNVVAPWRTSAGTHEEILKHCMENDRVAFLDAAQAVSVATLKSLAQTSTALGTGAAGVSRLGGIFPQYARGSGVVPGSTRTVPSSIVAAGLTARTQKEKGHANVNPIGQNGIPRWARSMDRYFSEVEGGDGDQLVDAGLNLFVDRSFLSPSGPRLYSFQSLDTTENWRDLAHSRYFADLQGRVNARSEEIVGLEIDASGNAASAYGGIIRAEMARDYPGGLYGATFDDAARVDVGPNVNDQEAITAREIRAEVGAVLNEHGTTISVQFTKVPAGTEV
jgi:hypothetical protein